MNKKIVENYMNEVWNRKNIKIVKEVFSDSAVIHSPLGQFKSPQEMSDTVSKWITAIPDIQVDLLNTFEDNGIIVSHWKAKGTHQKDFNGIKANGNPVAYQGVSMYRLENNKIIEYWAFLDSWTLEQQMKEI
ncbi:Uncharacterized protein SCG7086_CL_00090 [Chlamydiales bacterium SCGC AG-110-P3]|nr:Uncharacterized protein SCG7086_CL_00090 [Chlamydiales bacterium SCGC AG-110-P3]